MTIESGIRVFKFGGTSVGSAEGMRRAAAIIRSEEARVVVVVSALGGITNLLLEAAKRSVTGDVTSADLATADFRRRHSEVIEVLVTDPKKAAELQRAVDESAKEFYTICRSLAVLNELSARTIDVVVGRGEEMSALIFFTFLESAGIASQLVDATEVLHMMRRFEGLSPDYPKCEQAISERILPIIEAGRVVVLPGFIATGPDGKLITLGRGGSDYSATILARLLSARDVVLFKEVDGFLTSDPRYVPSARLIPELSYREATELAYYGAKVLHPQTIIPLLKDNIPLTVKNSATPEYPGTRIVAHVERDEFPVKALSAMQNQALVTVEGNGMLGVSGIVAKTFAALANEGISVSMITQASSEATICFVVPEEQAVGAQELLKCTFEYEIALGLIDDVLIDVGIAVLAVVGLGMCGTPGIASRTFSSLARKNINIIAIAQGSSELNISFVIRREQVPLALQALHDEYRLEKLRPLPVRSERVVELALYGVGQIGRTFLKQFSQQSEYLRTNLSIDCKCVAIADRSGLVAAPDGFSAQRISEIVQAKETGCRLKSESGAAVLDDIRSKLFAQAWQKGILLDFTAEESAPLVLEALEQGFHVVLANKKPLTTPIAEYSRLFETARSKNLALRFEAAVGAGLPILDTLSKMRAAGDEVFAILGCLSGTLGFIATEVSAGRAFSDAVRVAFERGYTEPHPVEDLSGMDVARKALILARTLGHQLNLENIAVDPLYSRALYHENPRKFVEGLTAMNERIAARVEEAARDKRVIRYVARIDQDGVRVGLEAVPEHSPLARLVGSEIQVVIRTRRYDETPFVLTGPGAGAEVTAAGVLNDVLAIASANWLR